MSYPKLGSVLRGSAALVLALFAGLASATERSTLNLPKGVTDLSHEVYDLHMLIFWVCVAIAVVVFGVMIWSIIHHRKSKGAKPADFHDSVAVEIAWTVVPFLILIAMAIPSARTLIKMEDFRKSDLTIKVTGYQWKWHYDYIDDGVAFYSTLDAASNAARQKGSGIDPATVPNYLLEVDRPLVVPVGKKVRLLLTANDVIHSWWVPDLGGKKDAIPGYIQEFWFNANEPGTYRGQCAELCGRDHGFMPVVVIVKTEADYAAWLAEQKGGATAAADTAAADAAREWTREELMARGAEVYATTCVACHGAEGQGNPAMNVPGLKGGAITTGPLDGHVDIVLNGSKKNPMMAPFGAQLSDADIAALVTFERNSFGNAKGDLVQPAAVAAARK
jgi:cytochrome c oxidase subunit 2